MEIFESSSGMVFTYRKGAGKVSGTAGVSKTSKICTLSSPKEYALFPGQTKTKIGVDPPVPKFQRNRVDTSSQAEPLSKYDDVITLIPKAKVT